jgi:hypothetical protein
MEIPPPFALSLSKGLPSCSDTKKKGFDRLSPIGTGATFFNAV